MLTDQARAPAPPTTAPAAASTPAPSPAPSTLARDLARPAPTLPADVPADVVELAGGQEFAPPEPVGIYLAGRRQGGQVRVRLDGLSTGVITVRRKGAGYETERPQPLPLDHPLLRPLPATVRPVIAVSIEAGVVTGRASVLVGGRLLPGRSALLDSLAENAAALGWHGLDALRFTGITNELSGTTLKVKAENLSFGISRFLRASGSLGLENDKLTVDATATGEVPGLGTITVPISLAPDGSLSGSAKVALALKGFSGELTAAYARGVVDVQGTVQYTNEKFDGQVTIVATDKESAKALTASHTPAEAAAAAPVPGTGSGATGDVAPAAGATEATAPAPGPRPGPRVVVGWGTVRVRLADWLSGEAMVVVDQKGDVTVVGTITPRMETPLFEQRDWIRPLPKLEVRALYGVPVVGNVFLFANVGLEAVAKLGPATLDRMEMTGTWSTDPDVLQSFGLTGTLNISAFAGLRLTAEGGAGVEILDHDIKAGVAISALAGIRGYVEATPSIGYRETADPQAGKRGEFFIAGHMEIAAQPFLGLSGEMFIDLDSPFWSPAPDKRWPWPIGQLEYPLPGEFGIGADVEHVLGSGTVPEITFGEVQFSPEKFMTDLVSDHVPPKKATDEVKAGTWKEGATAPGASAEPELNGEGPPPAQDKGARGRQDPEDGDVPRPEVQQRWLAGLKALGSLAETSHRNPQDVGELSRALAGLKKEYGFTSLEPTLSGTMWLINASMNPKTPRPIPIDADPSVGSAGADVPREEIQRASAVGHSHTVAGKEAAVEGAVTAIQNKAKQGAGQEELLDSFPEVERRFGLTSLELLSDGEQLFVRAAVNPVKKAPLPQKLLPSELRPLASYPMGGTGGLADPRLAEAAMAWRATTALDLQSFKANFAAFRVKHADKVLILTDHNDPGGLHSEAKIVQQLERLGGPRWYRNGYIIEQVFTERRPCTDAATGNCSAQLAFIETVQRQVNPSAYIGIFYSIQSATRAQHRAQELMRRYKK